MVTLNLLSCGSGPCSDSRDTGARLRGTGCDALRCVGRLESALKIQGYTDHSSPNAKNPLLGLQRV